MPRDIVLEFGKGTKDRVEAKRGEEARSDIALILDEAPDFMDGIAVQLVERAALIRGDKDCFRLTDDEVVIHLPALKRPTLKEVQKDWSGVRSIESDHSTEEPVTLRLSTVLKSTESGIDGSTYERRILTLRTSGRLLGFQHRKWLLENQKKFPALMALLGKVYIDFSGIIVVDGDGCRCIPCVAYDGGQWDGGWSRLQFGMHDCGRMAVSSK